MEGNQTVPGNQSRHNRDSHSGAAGGMAAAAGSGNTLTL